MNLAKTWKALEQETGIAGLSGRVQRRIMPEGHRNVFLGLEVPNGNRMLIIRVSAHSLPGQQHNLPDSYGLTVRTAGRDTQTGEAEVEVILTDARHQDIFNLLVRDLVEAAEQPQDEKIGVARMLSRLSDWQHLLRRLSVPGMSADNQRGLWGELWVMRTVIAPVLGIGNAISAWTGPTGTDQDFQMGSVCVEVKTSAAHVLDHVIISSERQLEVPEGVSLVLIGLALDTRIGHGETLPTLVQTVRERAAESGFLALLDDRLECYGYRTTDSSLYSENGYSVGSFESFCVGPEFPKLISRDLPTGINDVLYRISLASCHPHRMNTQNLTELLRSAP